MSEAVRLRTGTSLRVLRENFIRRGARGRQQRRVVDGVIEERSENGTVYRLNSGAASILVIRSPE